jgi:hypothetical protein
MRARVLGGRVRTSTVLLALVFLLTLATYLLVRPVPASVAATASPLATPRPAADRVDPSAEQCPAHERDAKPKPRTDPRRFPAGNGFPVWQPAVGDRFADPMTQGHLRPAGLHSLPRAGQWS